MISCSEAYKTVFPRQFDTIPEPVFSGYVIFRRACQKEMVVFVFLFFCCCCW